MKNKRLSPLKYRHINGIMREKWMEVLKKHFGDDIIIGDSEELPTGQIWILMGETLVGDNTNISEEIMAFSFRSSNRFENGRWLPSSEFCNQSLDSKRFDQVNDKLRDVLLYFMYDSKLFDPIKKYLAEELYAEGESGSHMYNLNIRAHLKDTNGLLDEPSKHFLYFAVTGADPDSFETSC